jgi:hypothetical protein
MVHTDLALIKYSRRTGHVISLKTTNFSGTIFDPIMRVMMVLVTLVVFNELRRLTAREDIINILGL